MSTRVAAEPQINEVQYDESPLTQLTEVRSVWNIHDSPMGTGAIEAEAKLDRGLVELKLRWKGDHEQPEFWDIVWWHHGDHILNELPEYLQKYCPVPDQMMEVLRSLGLEKFGTDLED
jgi:hypothetical protein